MKIEGICCWYANFVINLEKLFREKGNYIGHKPESIQEQGIALKKK